MASYQAKIGWKIPGKREYKKYRSVLFLPLWLRFEPKIGWKMKRKRKNKNYRYV